MDKAQELEQLIIKHKSLYYAGTPEINDFEYDQLEEQLQKLNPSSFALNIVGTDIGKDKVRHEQKMLSLAKVYSLEELLNWKENLPLVSIFKIDGISCSLVYENGELVLAKTRGDGSFGENITAKVYWLSSVPKKIKEFTGEIRGEIYCSEEKFFKLSKEMERREMELPSSQRNIVAGLMGRKDQIDLAQFLTFSPFDLICDREFTYEHEKLDLLDNFGFQTLEYKICSSKQDVKDELEKCQNFMQDGEYLIDGQVFIIDALTLHDDLGFTAHHPKFKMAFKFRGESADARINYIEWSVSRNGILTPVAIIDPVVLSGAKISRVTLHNFGMVNQFKLKSDDVIEIVRSGEVIPKFLSVRSSSENEFKVPHFCPSCSSPIDEVEIRLFCRNNNCPAQKLEIILNFVQKIGMNDLSSKRLEQMLKVGLIADITDLYKITKDDLLRLEKTKDKLADKILIEITKSLDADLITFLAALGIPGGAYNRCEKIVKSGFDSIEKVLELSASKLIAIDGFAEKSAEDFVNGIQKRNNLIKKLLSYGFNPQKLELHDSFCFCITGSLQEKRSVIESGIRAKGHKVVSSVTKATTHLVCNQESSSSKYKKALALKIPVITEKDLSQLLSE